MQGRTLGPYKIISQLGSGGMGDVYLAEDTRLGRRVAIKVLPPEIAQEPERLERLRREARVLASLDHPNVNTLYDIEEDGSVYFLVLQLVEGQTLERRLANPVPSREAIDICRQIAAALAEAHSKGIVHRDLKPANVMLAADGTVKVLDFGIAMFEPRVAQDIDNDPTAHGPLTRTGTILGTAPYMSPEQIRGADVDARADVWAFGCILFELLTGASPFRRETVGDTMAAVLGHDPDWNRLPVDTPEPVARLARRCLQKRAADRLHAIADARIELQEVLREHSQAGGSKALWAALAAAGIVVVLAALWSFGLVGGSRSGGPAIRVLEQRLITNFPGSHAQPTLSPDGTMVAFVSNASGSSQIWVMSLSQGDPVQITDLDGPVADPSWSPQNEAIIFSRLGEGIWTVGVLGSPPPRQIIEAGRSPSFSVDGQQIVYETNLTVWIADADGGDRRQLENVPTRIVSAIPTSPVLSPDGRSVAVFIQEGGPIGDFWIVPVDGGEARRLTFDGTEGGTHAFTEDGSRLVFSSKRSGSRTLWSVPVEGGEPEPVTSGTGEDSNPVVSRDGTRLVYTNVRNERALMVSDPESGMHTELLTQRYGILVPRVSPDGRQLAFFGEVRGGADVFVINEDGTGLRRLTHGNGELNVLPLWSADGSRILFYQQAPEPSLRRIPAGGGTPTIVFADFHPDTHQGAAEHPSGKWIAWARIVPPFDEDTTFIRDMESGVDTPIRPPSSWSDGSSFHVHNPEWSPDGRWLAGWAHDGQVWLCEPEVDCHAVAAGQQPLWSADGSRLYLRRAGGAPNMRTAWVVGVDGSDERRLLDYGPVDGLNLNFGVLPDGRIVWTQQRNGEREIWAAELGR